MYKEHRMLIISMIALVRFHTATQYEHYEATTTLHNKLTSTYNVTSVNNKISI